MTLVTTMIEGGIGRNVVPPACSILIDRRLLPDESASDAREEVAALVRPLAAEVDEVSLAEAAGIEPQAAIARAALSARAAVVGERSEAAGFGACCDMWHLTKQGGIPAVILGPGSLSQAHKTDEHIEIAELEKAVEIYRRLALDWLEAPRE